MQRLVLGEFKQHGYLLNQKRLVTTMRTPADGVLSNLLVANHFAVSREQKFGLLLKSLAFFPRELNAMIASRVSRMIPCS